MTRRLSVVLIATTTLALLAAVPFVRRVQSHRTGTTVISSRTEALVLVTTMDTGWKGSLASYALNRFARLAGSWGPRVESHFSMDVFVITPSEVQRAVVDGQGGFRGVVDGEIFANAGGSLSRWRQGRFVATTPSEAKSLEGKLHGVQSMPDGWQATEVGVIRDPAERTFSVAEREYRLRVWRNGSREWMTIRDGSGARIAEWFVEEAPRSVDEQTYENLFARDDGRARKAGLL